jgi:hypothetical protein
MNAEAIFNIGLSLLVLGTGLIVLATGALLCVLLFYRVATLVICAKTGKEL